MSSLKDHKFAYSRLDYSSEPNFQPAIKVSVFFSKLPSISHDEFFRHWQTLHADLVVATNAFKDNIVRYVQYHQTPEMKERAKSLGENFLEYDAVAELYAKSWDDWLKFAGSEEYAAALHDDCLSFIQLPFTYMVGYENLIVGDASQKLGGKDGILEP